MRLKPSVSPHRRRAERFSVAKDTARRRNTEHGNAELTVKTGSRHYALKSPFSANRINSMTLDAPSFFIILVRRPSTAAWVRPNSVAI